MQPLNILVIGAGKLGRESGQRFVAAGYKLTIIEKNHDSAVKAQELFGGSLIQGDGCDPKILERGGISRAAVILAATGDDEDNIIIAELAHRVFDVPFVMARVNRPENQWLFTKARGVDYAFCPVCVAADLIQTAMEKQLKA
ncbi:MAG: NAD-binding protein [Dehalococcoidales bacterium]|nr:NAD-binding protein [Dehalococcoidales bacterium]